MECTKTCVVIFLALTVSTAGFVLTLTGWFAPPMNAFVDGVRLAGPIILLIGSCLIIMSCILCAYVQGKCCDCCYIFSSRKNVLYDMEHSVRPDIQKSPLILRDMKDMFHVVNRQYIPQGSGPSYALSDSSACTKQQRHLQENGNVKCGLDAEEEHEPSDIHIHMKGGGDIGVLDNKFNSQKQDEYCCQNYQLNGSSVGGNGCGTVVEQCSHKDQSSHHVEAISDNGPQQHPTSGTNPSADVESTSGPPSPTLSSAYHFCKVYAKDMTPPPEYTPTDQSTTAIRPSTPLSIVQETEHEDEDVWQRKDPSPPRKSKHILIPIVPPVTPLKAQLTRKQDLHIKSSSRQKIRPLAAHSTLKEQSFTSAIVVDEPVLQIPAKGTAKIVLPSSGGESQVSSAYNVRPKSAQLSNIAPDIYDDKGNPAAEAGLPKSCDTCQGTEPKVKPPTYKDVMHKQGVYDVTV